MFHYGFYLCTVRRDLSRGLWSGRFSLGDLANGYYSGDHRLTDLSGSTVYATIAFEYSVANSTTYKVTTNTYSQLSQTDINEYATTCLQCLEQGLSYAQTIVSAYTNNITIK